MRIVGDGSNGTETFVQFGAACRASVKFCCQRGSLRTLDVRSTPSSCACSYSPTPSYVSLCELDALAAPPTLTNCISTLTSDPSFNPHTWHASVAGVLGQKVYFNLNNYMNVCDLTSNGLTNCLPACPVHAGRRLQGPQTLCYVYGPDGVAFSPDGLTVFISNVTPGLIAACDVDPTTGTFPTCAPIHTFTSTEVYGIYVMNDVIIAATVDTSTTPHTANIIGCTYSGTGQAATITCPPNNVLATWAESDNNSRPEKMAFHA